MTDLVLHCYCGMSAHRHSERSEESRITSRFNLALYRSLMSNTCNNL
ncbi:MAG: hypothetical protein IJW31_08260 [Lentisphaeria bacterium]|nr:hypothetical protein [Lentisphaeria bacterium]